MKTRSSLPSRSFKNIALIMLWLLIGGILFSQYGHINLLFPIILLGWILVGAIVWRIARQRKIGNIVTLLLLVLALCLPLSLIYLEYMSYQYDYALREFLMYVASGKESKLEFLPYVDTCDWHVWQGDFTTDYQAKVNDNFGIEMQWIVEFGNGSKYSIVMAPISLRRWEVCIGPHK